MATFPDHAHTVVVGAGLTGLVLAKKLLEAGHRVLLVEKCGSPGGLLGPILMRQVPVDAYYHHVFPWDARVTDLMGRLGLATSLRWGAGSVGLVDAVGFHRLTTPLDVARFNGLSFGDKARLALLIHRARQAQVADLDGVSARDWVVEEAGEEVWEYFLKPLVEAKFGSWAPCISAAWLASRMSLRSGRGLRGERLGFLVPGFHALVARLAEEVEEVLWCSHEAVGVVVEKGRVAAVTVGSRVVACQHAVLTGGAREVLGILGDQATHLVPGLSQLACQGLLCGVFLVEGRAKGAYWTNVTATGAPFRLVVQQDLLSPVPRLPGVVYASQYVDPTEVAGVDPERVLDRFQEGLRVYMDIPRERVVERVLAATQDAGLVYTVGTKARLAGLSPSCQGLHLAGMGCAFPDRSMELCLAHAERVAADILASGA